MKKCLFGKPHILMAAGCLLAGLVMTASCSSKESKNDESMPNDSIVLGLDVSKYQGQIDWQNLSLYCNCVICNGYDIKGKCRERNLPVRFVIIRATKSSCVVDERFHNNFDNAKRQGIVRGAYHFLVDSVSGAKQAEHYLSVAKLEKGDLPPVLDMEKDRQKNKTIEFNVSVEEWRNIAKEWLDVVEKHFGVKAVIYTNLNGYKNWIKNDEILSNHDLWIAYPYEERDSLPQNWTFWQFSQKGHARGITENVVDLDLFNGTPQDLKQYIAEKGIGNR